MAFSPVVLVTIFVASTNIACSQRTPHFNIQPAVTKGYNGTCPLEKVVNESKQSISSEVRNILSCRYLLHNHESIIFLDPIVVTNTDWSGAGIYFPC